MIQYLLSHSDDLSKALLQHIEIVLISVVISVIIAAFLVVICNYSGLLSNVFINILSVIYSIPSLALLALLIPVTGLGAKTAITALTIYNQYILLRSFLAGLNEVDSSITEAATGLGMTKLQVLLKIRVPLAKKSLFTGVRLAIVSTICIATIAASINAGGLGKILFDGLRTMNINKILWGSILSACFAVASDRLLMAVQKRFN